MKHWAHIRPHGGAEQPGFELKEFRGGEAQFANLGLQAWAGQSLARTSVQVCNHLYSQYQYAVQNFFLLTMRYSAGLSPTEKEPSTHTRAHAKAGKQGKVNQNPGRSLWVGYRHHWVILQTATVKGEEEKNQDTQSLCSAHIIPLSLLHWRGWY